MKTEWQEIYRVDDNYQGHIIKNSIEEILNYDIKRDYLYRGENIYVPSIFYEEVLAKTMPQLIRRKPHGKVEWIDYTGITHPYDKFPLGTLVIAENYINKIKNNEKFSIRLEKAIQLTKEKASIENIDIKSEPTSPEILRLESDIVYEDNIEFWKKLRLQGIASIIQERQKQYFQSVNDNFDNLAPYIDSFISNNWNGKPEQVIQYKKTNNKK